MPSPICPNCRSTEFTVEHVSCTMPVRYDGATVQIPVTNLPVLQCVKCGADLHDSESDARIDACMREFLGLLTPGAIREHRRRLGYTQEGIARLIGFASESLSRWETGSQVQSRAIDRSLRVFFASSEARAVFEQAAARAEHLSDATEAGQAIRTGFDALLASRPSSSLRDAQWNRGEPGYAGPQPPLAAEAA